MPLRIWVESGAGVDELALIFQMALAGVCEGEVEGAGAAGLARLALVVGAVVGALGEFGH